MVQNNTNIAYCPAMRVSCKVSPVTALIQIIFCHITTISYQLLFLLLLQHHLLLLHQLLLLLLLQLLLLLLLQLLLLLLLQLMLLLLLQLLPLLP